MRHILLNKVAHACVGGQQNVQKAMLLQDMETSRGLVKHISQA